MNNYYFDDIGRFVIENYNVSHEFASFLPGIAGKKGIPLWAFYVNRGQAIASVGIAHKDNPIIEFHPAFRSYQTVFTNGFRTFIKQNENIYEPFQYPKSDAINQRMHIGINEVEIVEINKKLNLEISVLYFTLPQERIAALLRKVTIRNISKDAHALEILDGLPTIIPYGINDYGLKHVGNTLKAWMQVYNLESGIPLFKMRSSTEDTVEVKEFNEGNFYMSIVQTTEGTEYPIPIIDANLVFGYNTAFDFPSFFANNSLKSILNKEQIKTNKVPCAFTPLSVILSPNEQVTIYSVIGHTPDITLLEDYKKKFSETSYVERKYLEGNEIINALTEVVHTETSSRLFNEYCKQSYLDNLLRGGYPLVFKKGDKPLVYHIYSRKHGDLERDYNYFVLLPEYYSSGNGNYRDINQNRRNDVFFNPDVERYNIKFFINLIQSDGYNPLVINGVKYKVRLDKLDFLKGLVEEGDNEKLLHFLLNGFTPGKLIMFLEKEHIKLKVDEEEFLRRVIEHSIEETDAVHGDGFWTDHWTYTLDLIESYLEIYPDKEEELLFDDKDYTYYDDYYVVLPRNKRYVYVDGKVRQYNSLVVDERKKEMIELRSEYKNLMRTSKDEIFRTTLVSKLINIALVKFATTDPYGMGIEMEAGKPGWYDALNGLPGLFGSSVAESFELVRLLNFLIDTLSKYPLKNVSLPLEVDELLEDELRIVLEYDNLGENKDFEYWNLLSDVREKYREKTKYEFSGVEVKYLGQQLAQKLDILKRKLENTLERAIQENDGIMPTYYYYEAKEYEIIGEENNQKFVRVLKFEQRKMPLFLEGVVRGFKIFKDKDYLRKVYSKVKESLLFDCKLKMYKVNAPLIDQPIEIGRAKAFTPGWLENESIWLHMEYKYMLEVLKAGLYEEFYSDFKNVFIPFLDPAQYGRSTLENSSFIASSANPDESVHGRGFVARLSGATAEFLSIWKLMFVGYKPFTYENGKLKLRFKPALPGWLFNEDGTISFKFLGRCEVVYHNDKKEDTFNLFVKRITLHLPNEEKVEIDSDFVESPYAQMIRNGDVKRIDIVLE
ncbi:MAG: cellobiose phosphorylase [Fervidobacterium sp.]